MLRHERRPLWQQWPPWQQWPLWLGPVVVALFAGVCFAPVVGFGFVYDDEWTIVENGWLTRPLYHVLKLALSADQLAIRIPDASRPVMVTSMWIDRQLFGLEPFGFHLHSLLLYAACTALATLFIGRLTRNRTLGVVGGLLFAVAPAHAEVVASINYREDLLASAGTLLVLCGLVGSGRFTRPEARAAWLWSSALGAVWLWALLAKESALGLLPALLILALASRRPRAWLGARARPLAALALALLVWGGWRAWLRTAGVDMVPRRVAASWLDRLSATARFETRGLLQVFWPNSWSPEYAREGVASIAWCGALLAVLVAAGLALLSRRTRRLAVGVLLTLGLALPMCPLVGPINERADRYLFQPALGAALAGVWLWQLLRTRLPPWAGVSLLLIALGPQIHSAHQAAAVWRDSATFWEAAVTKAPTSSRSWAGRARTLRQAGQPDKGLAAAERAFELDPESADARMQRIENWIWLGNLEPAREEIAALRRKRTHVSGLTRAQICVKLAAPAARECLQR